MERELQWDLWNRSAGRRGTVGSRNDVELVLLSSSP